MCVLQLLADLCGGQLKGDSLKSSDVTFDPGDLKGGNHTADTHTAGWVRLSTHYLEIINCSLHTQEYSAVAAVGPSLPSVLTW